ncbi:MAG: hypothetical protein PUB21_11860 [Bacteroidales bacterium]|nr:hypothetical protein [Bacteroidales bacterium]
MINTMYIGSGDVKSLMSSKESASHILLMQRFVSGVKPYYNAKNSPIDALRIGAILEDRYLLTLPENYYAQYPVISKEMDVFKCTLDFAKIENGKIIDFEELKTLHFLEFLKLYEIKDQNESQRITYIKKAYKSYFYQVQEQLYCTELNESTLTFLAVNSYDDSENLYRVIEPNEICKFRIHRDEEAISEIKERGRIFQQIKDYYKE